MQGIYRIINLQNQKVYIGQVHINKGHKRRWAEHKSALRYGKHYNKHLQSSWNKYGENSFLFEMIEEVLDASDLNIIEQKWIKITWKNSYNIQFTAKSGFGQKRSLTNIAKENIAKANKKRKWTKKDRKKLSEALIGIKRSDKFKESRREIMLGTKQSEETKKKKSVALLGRVFSEETRKKMSQAKKGRVKTQIEIQKRKKTISARGFTATSGYKGVYKRNNRWGARITMNRKPFHLGYFDTAQEAAKKYDIAATEFFGQACYLNFPEINQSQCS